MFFLRFQYEEFYVKNIKIVFPLWFIYEIYDPALRIIKKHIFLTKNHRILFKKHLIEKS